MPKRNAPEFYWDEKRKRYRKRIKDKATGKWVSVYGKTKDECRSNAKRRAAELAEAARVKEIPFVFEYAAKWFELYTAEVGEKRKDDYRNAINNHICPVIGGLPITDVTPDDIAALMLTLSDRSHSLQQKVVTTLKRIFKSAVKNKLINESPCEDLKAGGKDSPDKVPLTKTQRTRLLDAVKGTRAELFIMIGLYTGLRREEILGLKWDSVYLSDGVSHIAVRRAVKWDGKNAPIVSELLKSNAAYRNIPLPPQLIEPLTLAKNSSNSEFVICNKNGGAMSATSFRKMWDAVRVRSVRDVTHMVDGKTVTEHLKLGDKIPKHNIVISIDFPVTPHQLRHTYITEMILSGANIKTVQYLAGHKSVQLTLDIYTKLMANRPEDTIHAVLGAFGAPRVVPNNDESKESVDKSIAFDKGSAPFSAGCPGFESPLEHQKRDGQTTVSFYAVVPVKNPGHEREIAGCRFGGEAIGIKNKSFSAQSAAKSRGSNPRWSTKNNSHAAGVGGVFCGDSNPKGSER